MDVAHAIGEVPRTITLDGRLFSNPALSTPLLDPNVSINVQVLNPAKNCVIAQQTVTTSTATSDGYFKINIGSLAMMRAYYNSQTVAPGAGCAGGYTPAAGDVRYLRVTVTPTSGVAEVLSPDLTVDSVPNAFVAESVQGLDRTKLLELGTNVELTQANIENVFSVANFPKLTGLLSGSTTDYVRRGTNGSAVAPAIAGNASTPAAGQFWYDTSANVLKYYDGTTVQTLGGAVAAITSGTIGGSTSINTSGAIATSGNIQGNQISARSVTIYDSDDTNFITIQTPATALLTSNYSLTLPVDDGTSGQILTTNGSGVLSWTSPAAGGVTSVTAGTGLETSPGAGITSTGSIGIAAGGVGTTQLADGSVTQAKLETVSGLTAAAYGSASAIPVVTVDNKGRITAITTTAITALPSGTDGQFLRNTSGTWGGARINITDIRSSLGMNPAVFPAACTTAQTLRYDVMTDTFVCTAVQISAADVTSGVLPIARGGTGSSDGSITGSGALTFAAGGTNQNVVLTPSGTGRTILNGNVGVGTTNPTATLHVNGQLNVDGNVYLGSNNEAQYIEATGQTGTASHISLNNGATPVLRIPTGTSPNAGNVGIGTTTPEALLHVNGTIKVAAGAETCTVAGNGGLIRYSSNTLQFCNGSSWQTLGISGAGLTSLNGQTGSSQTFAAVGTTGTAPAFTSGSNTHTLNIPMASATSVTAGLISKTDYDTFTAKLGPASTFSGDVSGTSSTTSVDRIKGTAVTITSLTNNDYLRYNGTAWVNSPLTVSGANFGSQTQNYVLAAPTGSAGNPTFRALASSDLPAIDAATKITGVLPVANGGTGTSNGSITGTGALTFAAGGTNENVVLSPSGTGNTLINGNVGIGTTSPNSKLDVSGNITLSGGTGINRVSNNSSVAISGGTTTANGASVTVFGSTHATTPNEAFVDASITTFRAVNGGATKMILDSSGNLKIGSTAPATKLDVNGTIKVADGAETCTVAGNGGMIRYTGGNLQFCNGSSWQTLGVSGAGLTSFNGQTGSSQSFAAVGTSGTAPAFTSGSNTHTLNIPMAATTGVTAGLISKTEYDTFNAKLGTASTFSGDVSGTSSTTSVDRIKGTAVTITSLTSDDYLRYNGTAWINSPLTVTGANFGSQTQNFVLAAPTGSAGNPTFRALASSDLPSIDAATKITGILPVANGGTGTSNGSITGTGALTFSAGGTNQNVVLTPSGTGYTLLNGYVGLGTTTPANKLAVVDSGNTAASGTISVNNSFVGGNAKAQFNATADGSGLEMAVGMTSTIFSSATPDYGASSGFVKSNGTGGLRISVTNNSAGADVIFSTNNSTLTEKMRLRRDGNLGIGTNAPDTKLDIRGANGTTLKIVDGNQAVGRVLTSDANGVASWAELPAASGGTVTSVTSANTDISVATTTTTPVLTLNSGTGANQILKLNGSSQIPAVDGSLLTSLNASNLGSGTVPAARMPAFTGDVTSSAGSTALTLGTVSIAKGGTGQTTALAGFNALSPLTTKGDLLTRDTTNNIRLPVGADGKVLKADSAQSSGLTWGDAIATELASITGTGLVQRTAPGTYVTLGTSAPLSVVGSNLQIAQGSGGVVMDGGNTVTAAMNIGSNANFDLNLRTNSTTKMTIQAGGNVGINTTTPDTKLDVRGTNGTTLKIVDGNQGAGKVLTSDANGVASWATAPGAGSGQWNTGSASSINYTAGNVGIGTNAPTVPLEVTGNSKFNVGNTGMLTFDGGSGIQTFNFQNAYGAGLIQRNMKFNGSTFDFINGFVAGSYIRVADDIQFGVAPAAATPTVTTALTIANNGRVGVSTNTPDTKLDIRGTTGATLKIVDGNQGAGKVLTSDANGVASWADPAGAGGTTSSSIATAGGQVSFIRQTATDVATASRSALTLRNDGTGTTNEYNLVALNAAGAVTSYIRQDGAASFANSLLTPIIYGSSSASGTLTLESTSHATKGSILVGPSGGKVGIGTTTPIASLQVATSVGGAPDNAWYSGDSMILQNDATTGTSVYLDLIGGSAGLAQMTMGTRTGGAPGAVGYNLGSNFMYFHTGASERMRITSGGNVGIGTSSPNGTLDVVGASSSYIRSPSGTLSYPLTIVNNNASAANDRGAAINFRLNGNELGAVGAAQQSTNNGYLVFLTATSSALTEKMRIDSVGNVGIGTNNPSEELSVEKAQNNKTLIIAKNTTSGTGAGSGFEFYTDTGRQGAVWSASSTHSIAHYRNKLLVDTDSTNSTGINLIAAGATSDISFYTGGYTTAQERMRILPGGNVGIGTSNPGEALTVRRSGGAFVEAISSGTGAAGFNASTTSGSRAYNTFYAGGATADARTKFIMSEGGNLVFAKANDAWSVETYQMVINNSGNVGIGSTNPGEKLDVVGNVRATAFISTSDRRFKTNIETAKGLETVLNLTGVDYDWKKDGKHETGVIAQDVEKVLPSAVVTDKDGFKAVKYQNLIAPLIESVKQLFSMIKSNDEVDRKQAREIASVKEHAAKLEAENKKLKEENSAIRMWICSKDPQAALCN